MIIYYENFPKSMTAAQIMKKGSYSDFTKEEDKYVLPWDLAQYRDGIVYNIPVSFTKEGLYYIHLYTDKKEITKPVSMNTKGKTPVTGIVIKVNK